MTFYSVRILFHPSRNNLQYQRNNKYFAKLLYNSMLNSVTNENAVTKPFLYNNKELLFLLFGEAENLD